MLQLEGTFQKCQQETDISDSSSGVLKIRLLTIHIFSFVYFYFVREGLFTIILVFVVYPVTVTLVECIFFISELTTKGSAECFTFRLLSYSCDTDHVCHVLRLAETRKKAQSGDGRENVKAKKTSRGLLC